MGSSERASRSNLIAPAICISTALFLVLMVGGWGAYRDLTAIRHTVIQAEINRLRSHAERSVGRIEAELLEGGVQTDLAAVAKPTWLQSYWNRTVPAIPDVLYGAVVDVSREVLCHSDPQHEGRFLSTSWNENPWDDFGSGIYETASPELSGGVPAVDISIPINCQNRRLGTFHAGMAEDWLDERVIQSRWRAAQGWIVVIGAILCVVLLTSLSLYRISRHAARLEAALALSDARRVTEVSQLIVGMAHEVRNPLNAIRLNLYTAERVFRGETQLATGEVDAMLSESVREIERVEELIQQLLGYARIEPQQRENFELSQEVRSALQFLRHSLERAQVTAEISESAESLLVRMDRSRLRQIILNLVNNACEAAGQGGQIVLMIRRSGDQAELSIQDTGPGVPAQLCERIFDPFFTTKESGTGMGLAVVRSLAEMAGGSVRCESTTTGCCFRLALPCET